MNRAAFRLPILLFVLTLAVAFFLRFYQIGQVPPGLSPDEATHALDAAKVLQGQLDIYLLDEGSTGALWRYLLALNFALFGRSILSLRAFASMVGVISAVMAYLLIRELSVIPPLWGLGIHSRVRLEAIGRECVAALAGLLLAVSYWHVDLSRTAFSAVLMLLVQDMTFFFLWRALNSARRYWFVLFGLGLGILMYNYLPGKLAPAVPLIFFLLQWLISPRNSLLLKHWRPLLAAVGIATVIALPFGLFVLFNYQVLAARATVPTVGAVAPVSPLQGLITNFAVFGLWPTLWLSGQWEKFFLGPLLTFCFVVGVGVSLARARRPGFLFLLIWWLTMLLPGALAPEGAFPHTRRAIGIATVTFAFVSLGLASLVVALFWPIKRLRFLSASSAGQWIRFAPLIVTMVLGFALVVETGANTFRRYFVQWGPSEGAKLAFHIYDLELADLMARQSGAETVYLLPLDSAAGSVNPLLDSITFVYRGQASYDFLSDDERTMPTRLAELTRGKRIARLLHWKVTKHTGADPKGAAHYYLEKWGSWVGTESYPYFDIETYELDGTQSDLGQAMLMPTDISFEGQMALTGYAFGNASSPPVDESSTTSGGLLWAELMWRRTANSTSNYQVALWLEDEAGHVVSRADKPLLNNIWHRGTGEWAVGAEERDYYLIHVDPTARPGTYRLKVVLYAGEGDGRRLAPLLPDIGADLAFTLGEVVIKPSLTSPDLAELPIPQPLDLEMGDGLRLLGLDADLTGPLRPGDRATLRLWWQARQPISRKLGVVIRLGRGERSWLLNELQPLGGSNYLTDAWPAGTVMSSFVDVRLPRDVETGNYDLEMSLLDIERQRVFTDRLLGQVHVVGRPHEFEIPPITHSLKADFGGQVTLLGYDLDLSQLGESGQARLTLYWQAQKEMETAYQVFVHLLDEAGQIVGQVDREPQGGEAPTTGWLAGEVVVDEIPISVKEAIVATQSIALGVYDPLTGKRLPLLDIDGEAVGDNVTISIR